MTDQRNLILAIVLSILIMLGFQFLFDKKTPPPPAGQEASTPAAPAGQPAVPAGQPPVPGAAMAPSVPGGMTVAPSKTRDAALAETPRVPIRTASIEGSIALVGGRVDDVRLVKFREDIDPASPEVVLLSPPTAPEPYFVENGWVPALAATKVPGAETRWTPIDAGPLTPAHPVALSWDNGEGLRFTRVFAIDDEYMITVGQKVENTGPAPVSLFPYGLVSRTGTPKTAGYYILHEGPLGVIDGTLKEYKYKDLQGNPTVEAKTTGGWLGITDKYWLTALVPDQKAEVTTRFSYHRAADGVEKYQTDTLGGAITVPTGGSATVESHIFAGAKELSVLDAYGARLGIPRFDLAIDFGWFYFLTKPFFYVLKTFHGWIGNFGLAIMALTVLVKGALFPLANKSYKAMSKMKKLQPEVQKLQQRFGEDKARLNQEMMALYKREKANPVAGCLPVFVQIPVFFALYKVLFVTIEMRHAPFYGWIHDLSAPDPTNLFTLFGVIPWTPPHFMMLGLWPVIMGITMFLQQRLNPAPADPVQAKMFMFLPLVFTFLLGSFPAGLVIYWSWSNTLSIIQQWVIMRKMGVKP